MEKESIERLKEARHHAEKEKSIFRKRLVELNDHLFTYDELMMIAEGLSLVQMRKPDELNHIELTQKVWSLIREIQSST